MSFRSTSTLRTLSTCTRILYSPLWTLSAVKVNRFHPLFLRYIRKRTKGLRSLKLLLVNVILTNVAFSFKQKLEVLTSTGIKPYFLGSIHVIYNITPWEETYLRVIFRDTSPGTSANFH